MNKYQKSAILFFLLIGSGTKIYSQYQDSTYLSINRSVTDSGKTWFVEAFCQDEKKLWLSPFKKPGINKIFWVPVIGATILSIREDETIYSAFKTFQSKHHWVDHLSPVITYGGDNKTVISVCALFFIGGVALRDDKAKQTGIMAAEALAHAGLIVTIGKTLTGRQRPSFDHGKDLWNWFPASLNMYKEGYYKSGFDAFPSGHTIAAWSVATVIAQQYREKKIIPILCYTIATGVGLSRITEDTHWLSDVILGGALGYSIGRFVVRERSGTRFTFLPVTDGKSVMIQVSALL
jgi:membrane-associated phospholipid phosphatase